MSTNAELIERLRKWLACPNPYDTAQEAADRIAALVAERDKAAKQIEAIHSIALEAKPHMGCACAICRIRRVCDGREIEPDPAKLLPERLCSWRKREQEFGDLIVERDALKRAIRVQGYRIMIDPECNITLEKDEDHPRKGSAT